MSSSSISSFSYSSSSNHSVSSSILDTKRITKENKEQYLDLNKKLNLLEKKGEEVAVKEMRKYLAYYTKNLKNSSEFRNAVNKLATNDQVIKLLDKYFESL